MMAAKDETKSSGKSSGKSKPKPKARQVTYHIICSDCWKELDPDSHGSNWRYNRVKEPCEHCADDCGCNSGHYFRIRIPEGLTVIL